MDLGAMSVFNAVSVEHYTICSLIPIMFLMLLLSESATSISSTTKQLLSIPLLAAGVIIPYMMMHRDYGMFYVVIPLGNFTAVIRLMDIFLITPIVFKGNPNYSWWHYLNEYLYVTKKRSDRDGQYQKNKKFYHLLAPIMLNCIIVDACLCYASTFSPEDIDTIYSSPIRYFILLLSFVIGFTCHLNILGQIVQMLYSVIYDNGYYAPDEWRPIMVYPWMGTSFCDVWSYRWHRILRTAWVKWAYKPIYHYICKWTHGSNKGKQLALIGASLGVFIASGLTHEYVIFCMNDWQIYKEKYLGQQVFFFTIHGLIVISEKISAPFIARMISPRLTQSILTKILLHIYVITVAYYTFPYFMEGFASYGVHRLGPIYGVGLLMKEYLKSASYLHPFCGSLV